MFQKISKTSIGIILAIIGVILFSAKAVMVKMAYSYKIDHLTLLLFRMCFALPFYLVIAIYKTPKQGEHIKFKSYLWLIFFGFLGYYVASLLDFMGLQYIKAGLERIILFVYPTMVVFLSWVFFKKRISRNQFLAILITYLGVLITFWDEISISGNMVFWGGFLIFLSAFTYAAYLVGSGWLIPKFGVLRFTSYAMIVSTLCIIVHYTLVSDFDLFRYPEEVYYLGCAMAIFSTIIPSFLVSEAIKRLGASTFSIFGSLGPISTIVLAFFFLNERITYLQVLGISIVLLGVTLVSKKKSIN